MASRYPPSRYDNDARRSRSRDRSQDRRSLYSDGGPRRSSAESRQNNAAFQSNRDVFRDPLPRDTPRGPKALIEPPNGPRGGGYAGSDFRGRGGRGRGRGWRDDSRDRGRDRDSDFRDRREPPFRDERSRERERPDWRDRDRDGGGFRGRRPSPRGRSPVGRDFRDVREPRDPREPPLGVDADRARRGSRDGPLSAGSSSSDPPFGQPYRGGYAGRGRGGRGRGDWDRGRGRPFYDDRDRFGPNGRTRSQEGRFRERDDRDRDRDRDPRFFDVENRPRDPRDIRDDRDLIRDRDIRTKLDRTSHEPPTVTKDVSPPPVAPAAPSFGSVPNRTVSISEASSSVAKPPPTGPRALKDERTPLQNSAMPASEPRPPPTGPAKLGYPEGSPTIPSGPRGLRTPGAAGKQWGSPNFKSRALESPQQSRSNSFAQPRPHGHNTDALGIEYPESHQRPQSSDAKAGSRPYSDGKGGDDLFPTRRLSVGSPIDRGFSFEARNGKADDDDTKMEDAPHPVARELSPGEIDPEAPEEPSTLDPTVRKRPTLKVSHMHVSMPPKPTKNVVLEQTESSDDDDDENFGNELDNDMAEVEGKLKKLEGLEETLSIQPVVRHAILSIEAIIRVLNDSHSLEAIVGPIPQTAAGAKEKRTMLLDAEQREAKAVANEQETKPKDVASVEKVDVKIVKPNHTLPVPGIDVVDHAKPNDVATSDGLGPPVNEEDTVMEDRSEEAPIPKTMSPSHDRNNSAMVTEGFSLLGNDLDSLSQAASKQGSSIHSPVEEDDDDETDIEDIDLQSIQIVREHMETPPIDSLPTFDEKPWFEDSTFVKSLDSRHPSLDAFIVKGLKEEAVRVAATQHKQREGYAGNYEQYLRFTLSDDQDAVRSRGKFTCVATVPDPVPVKPVATPEPKTESTRRSRYASERDLERVLEESRRVEDEKRERRLRAEKEKYRTEKEAVIPLQYQTEEERQNEFYVDKSGYIAPEKIVTAWDVLPPIVNYTEEETQLFEKAYLEFPKQWGRISERIPERNFGTNIQFYYLKKDELNLKDKLKRRPRQRKRGGGRGKQRSSALVSELGNRENEGEENGETGDNGERRRPRRAAAPTFNSEATPATDEGITPAGTPGRRAGGSRAEGAVDKPERKPRGRRAVKDKEPKPPRGNQTLAAAPPPTKQNRSRSSSRVQNTDWMAQQPQPDLGRGVSTFEMPQAVPSGPVVPVMAPAPPQVRPPLMSAEPSMPLVPGVVFDGMAPPLRPEPPQQPQPPPPQQSLQQPPVATLDLGPTSSADRKPTVQASSYWSVPEANDFPLLLRSFGTDWVAIAGHMKTKTAVMVKNYYARQKGNNKEWELIAQEADTKKARGESRPQPPMPSTTGPKKRTEGPGNRPLAAADTIMEDAPMTKVEHIPTVQSMTGRFNVPIAAQPQPPQPPFVPVTHGQPAVGVQSGMPAGSLGHGQQVAQTMSPRDRPLRQPYAFEREREGGLVQPQERRTPLGQKHSPHHSTPMPEPHSRHPPPPSTVDPQMDRQRMEIKMAKEVIRQPLRVKQEPDVMSQAETFVGSVSNGRVPLIRGEPFSLGRSTEGSRPVAPAPQAPYAVLQQQPSRGLLGDNMAPSPQPPRPQSEHSRVISSTSINSDPYSTPPVRSTPTPAPSRGAEPRKTSSLMALLNDDPPPPPKRVSEVPSAARPSPTPPPQSRAPPPPAPPSQLRRDGSMPESQAYYGRNPPAAPSSMPALKPYTASPQAQSIAAPRHMGPIEGANEREYYGTRPGHYGGVHQPPPAGSPQAGHPYQPPPGQSPYSQSPYSGYGGPNQQPPAGSPAGQYSGLSSGPRGHEGSTHSREPSWNAPHQQAHPMQQQQQQSQQQQQQHQGWGQQPLSKTSQPPPAQSAWAAQHAAAAPKPPPPSSSVPPQPSWANTPPPPRGHNPMALRDVRDYAPARGGMQPPPSNQPPYQPSSRAPPPEPITPQGGPAPYQRYSNTPGPSRPDPRDMPQQRSYTPGPYESRGYQPPVGQDMREAQMREQQAQQQHAQQQQQAHQQAQQQQQQQQHQHQHQHQPHPSLLQQQLRPPQDGRHVYDQDRYRR